MSEQVAAWRWLAIDARVRRDAWIMELYAMGYGRLHIARVVDLTPQRVSQIVNSLGCGWR